MTTVAEEAGLADRETASRITGRLSQAEIIHSPNPSKGGKPTTWYFNYDFTLGLVNCDSPVTVAPVRTVTPQSQSTVIQQKANRDFGPVENSPTVIQNPSNRDSPVTGRVVRENIRNGKAEAEGDALRAAAAAADGQIRSAFQLFDNNDHPFGTLEFQLEWVATVATASQHEGNLDEYCSDLLPHVIERAIQNCLRKNISIPRSLYLEKRLAEQHRDATVRARLQR